MMGGNHSPLPWPPCWGPPSGGEEVGWGLASPSRVERPLREEWWVPQTLHLPGGSILGQGLGGLQEGTNSQRQARWALLVQHMLGLAQQLLAGERTR